jgi:dTDP-4-amino-4,6-dideoxygalactose transaminase
VEYRIPFVNPRKHYQRFKSEIDGAIADCLTNGDLVLRQQLRDFERSLADFVGTKYAVGVNSCYHALHFSLLAAGIGPGDEVITVAHTFVATVSAIMHCGAVPVLIDVNTDYNMNMDCLEQAVTPRTKAVIPVHLNGRVCEMDRLMAIAERHKLVVIEDAQWQGRSASLGASVFIRSKHWEHLAMAAR